MLGEELGLEKSPSLSLKSKSEGRCALPSSSFWLIWVRESEEPASGLVGWSLQKWCKGTGRRLGKVDLALKCLRMAMSQLWLAHCPRL